MTFEKPISTLEVGEGSNVLSSSDLQNGDDNNSHTEELEVADDLGIEVFQENSSTWVLESIDENEMKNVLL